MLIDLVLYNGFMERENITSPAEAKLINGSKDSACRFYLREIERSGRTEAVENYLAEKMATQPEVYDSVDEFLAENPNYMQKLSDDLSYKEKVALRSYSGYRFAWINSVARGFWDYEKMGRKTPELEEEIKDTTRTIIGAFSEAPAPEKDFLTFRGTNLDEFRSYGVREISDLAGMEGQFMLSQGFTSTAIRRDKSFAEREVSDLWIGRSNVEIRFRIPAGSHETIALLSDELSYSPQQTEVLIDHDALSYVSNVTFDKENHAVIDAILIPREVYDPKPAEQ